MRKKRVIFFGFLCMLFYMYFHLYGLNKKKTVYKGGTPMNSNFNQDLEVPHIGKVFWHLDLKGAPPKVDFLEIIFTLTASAGATGVLIEWEDMFPYKGILANFSALNAYSFEDIKRIKNAASNAGLEIISLIQSLGHLEFVLKQEQWRPLREIDRSVSEACPTNPKTKLLIIEAIDQVLSIVPGSMIHIGADEVYALGKCSRCRSLNKSPYLIYLDYIHSIAEYVATKWNVQVLMWDDMLRSISSQDLDLVAEVVQPVAWAYSENIAQTVSPVTFYKYANVFSSIWVASAFKGAYGPRAVIPDASRHTSNVIEWVKLTILLKDKSNLHTEGIFITGWSRYNHFAALCELLPPSVPSLILSIVSAHSGNVADSAISSVSQLLKCPDYVNINLSEDSFLWQTRDCTFPGVNLMNIIHEYIVLRTEIKNTIEETEVKGAWLTDYNVNHNFSSTLTAEKSIDMAIFLQRKLKKLIQQCKDVLLTYFDHYTADEWIEQHLTSLSVSLEKLLQKAKYLSSFRVWSRRPV